MAENKGDRRAREAGYGRPPENQRIKPGEKRNPWGRNGKPKPKTDFLDELVEVRIDGKVTKVTREAALDYAMFQEGLKGKVSAVKEVAARRKERDRRAAGSTADALLSHEKAALDRFIQRQLEELETSAQKAKPTLNDERLDLLTAAAREIAPGGKK